MTLAEDYPGFVDPARTVVSDQSAHLPLTKVLAITLLAAFAISLPNLVDPFFRHDDYPAFFGDAKEFWIKTLNEGRWLNYVWHLRGIETPAWLNFALYQALWAVLAASIAVAAMGRDSPISLTILLALFILVATPNTLIARWFNTLIPGLGIVALYAVLGCRLSQRHHRALLPVFVIVSFSAYTSYPFILLAVCLVRTQNKSLRDLAGLVALFVASFAAAVLLTYTLNWAIHGVFGVPLAEWRKAVPAHDVAGLIDNLPILGGVMKELLLAISYKEPVVALVHVGLLVLSTGVLIRRAPIEALYLHAGLWIGMAAMALQVVKLGVHIPARTFIFTWIFYAVIVVRAVACLGLGTGSSGRSLRAVTIIVVAGYLFLTFYQFLPYRTWQAETATLNAKLEALDPDGTRPLLIYGDPMSLSSARLVYIQREEALAYRLRQLSGRQVLLCDSAAEACNKIESSRRVAGLAPALQARVEKDGEDIRLSGPGDQG